MYAKEMESEIIECSSANVWMDEDGIIWLVYHPGAVIALPEAIEISDAIVKLSRGKKRPLYSDARNLKTLDRAAREYWETGGLAQATLALATHNTPIIKVLGGIFIRLNRPPYPLRFFSSEEESLAWLREFLP